MTIPLRKEGKIKLQEGMILDFLLKAVITLQDQKQYFILEDPDGMKHFLEEEPYQHYHLKTGSYIRCRVDKINCTGRVFLEPEHPYYKTGAIYHFRIQDHDMEKGYFNLIDQTGRTLSCQEEAFKRVEWDKKSWIRCRITGNRKGILELEPLA